MQKIRHITLFLGVLFLSITSWAEEIKTQEVEEQHTSDTWPLLRASDADSKKYRGVAAMDNDGFGCTAFIVRPPNCSSFKTQKAIVMTNGHCTKALDPNGVTRSSKTQKMEKHGDRNRVVRNLTNTSMQFKFGDYIDAKDTETVTVNSEKILYASMKDKDLSVIQLDKSYADLEAAGIPSYELAPTTIPQNITTVGRPFEGVPSDEKYLRQAQCKIEKKVGLIEGDWFWPNSIGMNCPARKGASGSPMFNDKGQVVGILNTGSTTPGPGSPRCPSDSPCEIGTEGQANYTPYKSYGFETAPLTNCFQKCQWNVSSDSCGVAKDSAPNLNIRKSNMQRLKVDFTLPAPYTHVKYKVVPHGSGSCSTNDGYIDGKLIGTTGILETSQKNQEKEGKHQLCVLSGIRQPDGSVAWDSTSKAYAKNITIDRTPPKAKVSIIGGTISVKMENPVDMGDANPAYKKVKNIKDCNNNKDYGPQKGAPWKLPPAGEYVCVKAVDGAGNWQAVATVLDSKGPI